MLDGDVRIEEVLQLGLHLRLHLLHELLPELLEVGERRRMDCAGALRRATTAHSTATAATPPAPTTSVPGKCQL